MSITTQIEETMVPRPLEEIGDVGALAQKLRSGQAILKVVAYPWGVEFHVYEAEVEA